MHDPIANFTGVGHAIAFPAIDATHSEVGKYATAWISDATRVVRTCSNLFHYFVCEKRGSFLEMNA